MSPPPSVNTRDGPSWKSLPATALISPAPMANTPCRDALAELAPALSEQVRDGDVVIAMGAGSIGTVAQTLKDLLEGTR